MKKYLIFIISLSCFLLNAQQSGTVLVDWNLKTTFNYGETKFNLPQFNAENYSFDFSRKQINFGTKFLVPNFVDESSLKVSNVSYEIISESELGDLNKKEIPTEINAFVKNCISREEIRLFLGFSPIINENGVFKKVISLNYTFQNDSNLGKSTLNQTVTNSISNSVLSTGTWKRFYVGASGVYKISKSFLDQIGFSVSALDPKKIKIFGNGGRILPLKNAIPYPIDLEENAIQIVGENDGQFNGDDYILFYAEGTDNWSEENGTHLNVYSDRSYYYVTYDANDGKRIATQQQSANPTTLALTTFDDYRFYETDLNNIGKVGRIWVGDSFTQKPIQEFNFNFPAINNTAQTQLIIQAGASSFVNTNFTITANGLSVPFPSLNALLPNSQQEASINSTSILIPSVSNFNISLTYNNSGVPVSRGYLDYIILKAKSNLVGIGKQFRFQFDNATSFPGGTADYQFSNAAAIKQVWNITDIYNVTSINYNQGSNFSIKTDLGSLKKFIAIDESDFYSPSKENNTSVSNQNLKGTIFKNAQGNFQDIDYLIVAPRFLINQAERLANFHRTNSNMSVKVVPLDLIYNEFGGGKQDISAIRNFVKYVYQNASTPANKVKYLNLFGDASFDFRDRIKNNTNIVPIFQSLNSETSTESSFPSDDFFVLMDANEGEVEGSTGYGTIGNIVYGIDIAVGRMIVSSTQQADEMVNKVIEYHDPKSYGNWRNNYVSVADDADTTADTSLHVNQNNITEAVFTNRPFINYKKIFLDAFAQQTSAGGDRYPQAREDLFTTFERGALVFDYLGHGGEDGLTGERLWDKQDGINLKNQYRYPLFITITCDFSKFDNPLRPTAGELTYLNPKGGAIAMMTTTRTIGQYNAEIFNDIINKRLFAFGQTNYTSMAEALRLAKNEVSNNSSTKVVLFIGDPAIKLAIPTQKIVLTKVNDVAITQPIDDLKALSYVKLTGEVQDENGTVLTSYNGELFVNVFDKIFTRTTNNNDFKDSVITFNNLGETVFRGNASVTNGNFEFGFTVPKDIKIPLGNGRVSFYSKKENQLLDKTGLNTTIKIGGLNLNAVADVTPPKIRLYMNDETFVNGGITNESPYFLAFLEDEHGINTASGIGHDIVAILDGDESKPFILNDYYDTELNNYQKGKIRFLLRKISKGLHTLKFKAWDTYNNYISQEIQFVVVGDEEVTLTNVLNYPNPFVDYTQFWFTHNKPFEPLEVQVQVMTITGKVVKSINQTITNSGFLSRDITWDGKDDFGDRIGKGVYIYKLTVRSTISDQKAEKIEKLVIL